MIAINRSARLSLAVAGVLASTVSLVSLAIAQTAQVDAVVREQAQAEQAAKASQDRIGQLDEQSSKMLAEYRQAVAEVQSLRTYNEQVGAQVASQQAEITAMTQQLTEIETTAREVQPMMQRMMATLEQFVALDMPFLPDERNGRIADLKEMMTRADVSISEKYRRIVEAYQIEMEYGRTIEAYQGRVDDKTVEFLRSGRVGLLYQTLDGKETGYWDAQQRKWVVDDDYHEAMKEGLKVAKKQAAPDFIQVAVAAAKETGQ